MIYFFLDWTDEAINIFEITYDFTSNWYLNRKTSWRLRNLAFSCDRQSRGHARVNKERSFTARVDRMDPVVNDDIRLGWCSMGEILRRGSPAFSRSGALFHMCKHLVRTMVQSFSRKNFFVLVRSVCTGSIRQILGTILVCRRKYLVKCNCGYWIYITFAK